MPWAKIIWRSYLGKNRVVMEKIKPKEDFSVFFAVFCRFQVNVSEELALLGVQLLVVIVSVSGTLPVFLT
jgi:hypothetical protein